MSTAAALLFAAAGRAQLGTAESTLAKGTLGKGKALSLSLSSLGKGQGLEAKCLRCVSVQFRLA